MRGLKEIYHIGNCGGYPQLHTLDECPLLSTVYGCLLLQYFHRSCHYIWVVGFFQNIFHDGCGDLYDGIDSRGGKGHPPV